MGTLGLAQRAFAYLRYPAYKRYKKAWSALLT
jgi:hypothetical protein